MHRLWKAKRRNLVSIVTDGSVLWRTLIARLASLKPSQLGFVSAVKYFDKTDLE